MIICICFFLFGCLVQYSHYHCVLMVFIYRNWKLTIFLQQCSEKAKCTFCCQEHSGLPSFVSWDSTLLLMLSVWVDHEDDLKLCFCVEVDVFLTCCSVLKFPASLYWCGWISVVQVTSSSLSDVVTHPETRKRKHDDVRNLCGLKIT